MRGREQCRGKTRRKSVQEGKWTCCACHRREPRGSLRPSLVTTGWRIEGTTFRRKGKGHERSGRFGLKRGEEACVRFERGDRDWLSDGKRGGSGDEEGWSV